MTFIHIDKKEEKVAIDLGAKKTTSVTQYTYYIRVWSTVSMNVGKYIRMKFARSSKLQTLKSASSVCAQFCEMFH